MTLLGQYGPDAQIDTAGNALIGAAVSGPTTHAYALDGSGNLTITGPATDALTYTITPVGGLPVSQTVRVAPLESQIETALAAKADVSAVVPYTTGQTKLDPTGSDAAWINAKNFKAVVSSYAHGYSGALIGLAHNDLPTNTTAFPVGLAGVGRVDHDATAVFGAYILAETYNSISGGGCAAEIDSFNYGGAASATYTYPPNRSFGGDFVPTGLLLGAGGTHDSFVALSISQEGSSPRKWVTGIYIDPNAIRDYPMFIGGGGVFPSVLIGNGTQRSQGYVAAAFGLDNTDDSIGAQVLIGSITGNSPFIAASLTQGSASPLLILTNNTLRAKFLAAGGLELQSGTALLKEGSQVVGARQTGWASATGTATRSAFATGTVTLSALAEHVKALIDDLTTHGLIGT